MASQSWCAQMRHKKYSLGRCLAENSMIGQLKRVSWDHSTIGAVVVALKNKFFFQQDIKFSSESWKDPFSLELLCPEVMLIVEIKKLGCKTNK